MVEKMYNQYNLCRMLFSKKEIIKACAKFMNLHHLTEEYVDRRVSDSLSYRKAVLKEKKICTVKRLHGPGSRSGATDDQLCSIFYVPNRYQYINGGSEAMEYLLKKKYGLDFKVYDIRNASDDIYIEINNKTLFVPFYALVERNRMAIEQRNLTYWKGYNKSDISNFVYSKEVQDILDILCA